MRQTTNYQLPSWDSDDRILRTDFNDLTEKVDTALAEKLGTVQLIKTVEPPSATRFTLDLTDIDWSQWSVVGFTMDLGSSSSTPPAVYISAKTAAGSAGGECTSSRSSFAEVTFMPFVLALLPLRDPERNLRCVYLGGNSGTGTAECTFQELTELSLSSGSTYFHPSYVLTLWGIP